jgi:hypothetical protein
MDWIVPIRHRAKNAKSPGAWPRLKGCTVGLLRPGSNAQHSETQVSQ